MPQYTPTIDLSTRAAQLIKAAVERRTQSPATAAEVKAWFFERIELALGSIAWEEYKEQQREGLESADVIRDGITVD